MSQEKLGSNTNIDIEYLFLNLVGIDFFIVSFHFTVLCTGHSAKKARDRFRYRAGLR